MSPTSLSTTWSRAFCRVTGGRTTGDGARQTDRQAMPTHFADLDLPRFLAGLTSDDGGATWYFDVDGAEAASDEDDAAGYSALPTVLIIDQFEELLTYYPERWEDRADFFRQLEFHAARRPPRLWIVLTLARTTPPAWTPTFHWWRTSCTPLLMPRMGVDAALAAR